MKLFCAFWSASILLALGVLTGPAAAATAQYRTLCDDNSRTCTEPLHPYVYWGGPYVGHDEPSLLFYSNTAGSGNSYSFTVQLPNEPPTLPTQNGKGGTFNFQLHPAFWVGMAMCDSQSDPNPGAACKPDTDANIFDDSNPSSPKYIGKHPGTAFMEMQFYPPGWAPWPAGISCDAKRWCAALNIDSYSDNPNTGQQQNGTCQSMVGIEYVNFAFITRSGKAQAPANPVDATAATYTVNPKLDLFMNSGDLISVSLHDTKSGLQVVIKDMTTGATGSMTASAANSFGQVQFDPTGTSCNNLPYNFHPMYATSSEHTRVPWTAHSYNIAFSDEIGHFEYCDAVDSNGNCTKAGVTDPGGVDSDDAFCFPATASLRIKITGCTDSDLDFDGPPYLDAWPGTLANTSTDEMKHAAPIQFTSLLFTPKSSPSEHVDYDRVAFETDMPRIEVSTTPPCNMITGANCVNPPVGAIFYPFYSTTKSSTRGCLWQLGGAHLPGTTNDFGGTSKAEYGSLLALVYPGETLYEDFRQILSTNPCK